VFDQVREDPPEATVHAATALARSGGVDGVLAVGGGSSMDVAKLVAFLAAPKCSQSLPDMYGVNNAKGARLPLIQVPTTAGTGSEACQARNRGAQEGRRQEGQGKGREGSSC